MKALCVFDYLFVWLRSFETANSVDWNYIILF